MNEEFWTAATDGDVEKVRQMLSKGVQISFQHQMGEFNDTCLTSICRFGHAEVLKAILEDGRAEINLPKYNGYSPLAIARENGKVDLVKMIKAHKAKVSTPEKDCEFVKKNLNGFAPRYLDALSLLQDILSEPETQPAGLKANLFSLFREAIPTTTSAHVNPIFRVSYLLSSVDSCKKEMVKEGVYVALAKFWMGLNDVDKMQGTISFSMILSKGRNIRESIGTQCQTFMDSLAKFLQNTHDLEGCGMALCMSTYYPDYSIYRYITEQILFPEIRTNSWRRIRSLCELFTTAEIDECRKLVVQLGAIDVARPIVDDPTEEGFFAACLLLALTSGSDTSSTEVNGESKSLAMPTAIKHVIKALDTFATQFITLYDISDVDSIHCSTVLHALRSLATNESNLRDLEKENVVSIMINLFKNRKQNLLDISLDTLDQAAKAVWVLAFDKKIKDEFVQQGMIDILRDFQISDADVKNSIDGALWILNDKSASSAAAVAAAASASSTPSTSGDKTGHIMISYSWSQKDRMRDLANFLHEAGFPIWIDVEQMEGSVLETMAEAVENSSVVVIGLSSNYKESQACRTEAEYAYRLKKEIVFVMVEDGYVATGWLGAMLGNKLWYNPWSNPAAVETGMGEIVKHLKKIRGNVASTPISNKLPPVNSTPSSTNLNLSGSGSSTNLLPSSPPPISSLVSPKFQKINYDSITLPKTLPTLTPENIKRDIIINQWKKEEVCSWLSIVGLDKLSTRFWYHEVNGKALAAVYDARNQGDFYYKMIENLDIDKCGLALQFTFALNSLFDLKKFVASWSVEALIFWFEKQKMADVAQKARKGQWTGELLVGLYELRKEESFSSHLNSLFGLKESSDIVCFVSKLVALFESSP